MKREDIEHIIIKPYMNKKTFKRAVLFYTNKHIKKK